MAAGVGVDAGGGGGAGVGVVDAGAGAVVREWVIGAILAVMAVQGAIAFSGRDKSDQWNRTGWWVMGVALCLAVLMPTVWASLLVAVIVLGCWPLIPRSDVLMAQPVMAVMMAAGWAMLSQVVTTAWVPAAMGVLIGLGGVIAAWGVYAKTRDVDMWSRKVWLWWYAYDESRVCPRAGQGNANHAQGMAALAFAACLGMTMLGSAWWGVLLPVLLVPVYVCRDARTGWLTQGLVHVTVATVAVGSVWLKPTLGHGALAGLGGMALVAVACLHPAVAARLTGFDSGRLRLWREVLGEMWWPQNGLVRMLGFGTGSWRRLTPSFTRPRFNQVAFTAAHNEYVEMVFQYGIIGAVVLLGFLGDMLWRAWTGGPYGEALFVLEVTLCSIAATSFPWTFFHACKEERPYAYTIHGMHETKGEALCATTHKAQAFHSHDKMKEEQVPNPVITVWYHQHPPLLLTEEHRHLDIDHDPPRHVGSPSLVMWSFILAVLGMTV